MAKKKTEIGKLNREALKGTWAKEDKEFTVWLEENISVLDEVLKLGLTLVKREDRAGTFSMDLLAQTEAGERVVIENQFGKSDHKHLGQLITYRSFMETHIGVWVVEEARPEHIAAINWLNESADARFYLVTAEVVRIDDSKPAPLFTVIVGPSEEVSEMGDAKREMTERDQSVLQWWGDFLAYLKKENGSHAHVKLSKAQDIGISAGIRDFGYIYRVTKKDSWVELYFNRPDNDFKDNTMAFEELKKKQQEIEEALGYDLTWDPMDGSRACKLKGPSTSVGYSAGESERSKAYATLLQQMGKLEAVMAKYLKTLKGKLD